MKIGLVYSSVTGNTKELVKMIREIFLSFHIEVNLIRVEDFSLVKLNTFDAIIIGTYTWGNGDIPIRMLPLYKALEVQDVKNVVTGVVGTGDRFYPKFCGAVDEFRDMLFVHSNLAATLKIELAPQLQDKERCFQFVKAIMARLLNKRNNNP